MNLSVSKKEWIRNSKIYRNMREQMRINSLLDIIDEYTYISNSICHYNRIFSDVNDMHHHSPFGNA
jgi:hypothetical protein